jgi:16S rRNA (guanine527-N7)-methyltransferase
VLEEARAVGFLGPGPVTEHIEHAEGFVRARNAPAPALAVDLGSGGGVPGLVLAARWPDCAIVLVDASERRTAFLRGAIERLRYARVSVRRDRAEVAGRDPALRGRADLVVARGFGPPAVTAECAAPLLRVGGRAIVSDPPDDGDSRWPAAGLAKLGLRARRQIRVPASFRVLDQVSLCPDRFPRRVGIPAKRPLF